VRVISGRAERLSASERELRVWSYSQFIRGGPNQLLHRDLQWSIVLTEYLSRLLNGVRNFPDDAIRITKANRYALHAAPTGLSNRRVASFIISFRRA
jgi:hypothetical protein